MRIIRSARSLLLLIAVILASPGWAADAGDKAKAHSFKGVIDSINVDSSKLVLKSGGDPAKAHTALMTIDKSTKITIDQKPGTFADLKEGDAVSVAYAQGTATSVVVTREKAKK